MSTTITEVTREELMKEAYLDDDEFDELYAVILDEIRRHGTHGVGQMLAFVEQELTAGREEI